MIEFLPEWTLHLRAAQRSPQTIANYTAGVRSFAEHAGDLEPAEVTPSHVRKWLSALTLTERGAAPKTISSRYQAVRSFFDRGPVDGASLCTMLTRRAARAGVSLHPYQLRHFFAGAWLRENGSEGGLMRAAGWSNRAMLDRYASANAAERSRAERRLLTVGDAI